MDRAILELFNDWGLVGHCGFFPRHPDEPFPLAEGRRRGRGNGRRASMAGLIRPGRTDVRTGTQGDEVPAPRSVFGRRGSLRSRARRADPRRIGLPTDTVHATSESPGRARRNGCTVTWDRRSFADPDIVFGNKPERVSQTDVKEIIS